MTLDDVIPNPQYRMCHARVVGAPPSVVWDELHEVTMSALPLGWALEAVRLMPARLSGKKYRPLAGRSFLDVTPIPVLFSERPDVVISAGLSHAWRLIGRVDTAGSGRGGSASLVAAGMDQGRDGISPRTHRALHAAEHRDPRARDGPGDTASVRDVLVLDPPEQCCDSSRGVESRRATGGVSDRMISHPPYKRRRERTAPRGSTNAQRTRALPPGIVVPVGDLTARTARTVDWARAVAT